MSTAARASSDERVDLGDGVTIPAEISATSPDVGGYTVDLVARYDPTLGRYAAQVVTVRGRDGQEVTSEGIRTIPVAGILRYAVASVVAPMLAPPRPIDLVALGKAGLTDATLQQVASIYRLALVLGDAPTRRVAEVLAVPRSTAGRWVTRARDRGYLTVKDPRGPGGG